MTTTRRPSVPHAITLVIGLLLGWGISGSKTTRILANGGDRWEESVLTAGPTFLRYNEGSKTQVAQDAVYFLDYRSGKLIGTIPSMRQSVNASRVLDGFAERDLAADFRLDTEGGHRPHFLMTTGSMSQGSSSSYGDGWAPLFVFETTTRQVAVYKIQQQMIGTNSLTKLDLLEIRPYGKALAAR